MREATAGGIGIRQVYLALRRTATSTAEYIHDSTSYEVSHGNNSDSLDLVYTGVRRFIRLEKSKMYHVLHPARLTRLIALFPGPSNSGEQQRMPKNGKKLKGARVVVLPVRDVSDCREKQLDKYILKKRCMRTKDPLTKKTVAFY